MNFRSRFFPVKSWIGDISANSSARPSSQNHLKDTSCVSMRLGSGRTSGSDAKLRRSRPDGATRSRATDMDGPSSGLMAGQADRQKGMDLWQRGQWYSGPYRLVNRAGTADCQPVAVPCQGVSFARYIRLDGHRKAALRSPRRGVRALRDWPTA